MGINMTKMNLLTETVVWEMKVPAKTRLKKLKLNQLQMKSKLNFPTIIRDLAAIQSEKDEKLEKTSR